MQVINSVCNGPGQNGDHPIILSLNPLFTQCARTAARVNEFMNTCKYTSEWITLVEREFIIKLYKNEHEQDRQWLGNDSLGDF